MKVTFGSLAASDAWERAAKASLTTPAWEQVGWLLEVLGARFTAASLGIADAGVLRRWRDEKENARDHKEQHKLQLLYRMVSAINGVYPEGSVAAGFLRSANPQLDDEAPLVLLANGDLDEVQEPLLAAVRAFLEG